MAKKAAAGQREQADSTKQLLDAIVTVRRLQDFVKEHGSLQRALDAVARVRGLVELTGGFDQLRQALEVVGSEGGSSQEPSPASE